MKVAAAFIVVLCCLAASHALTCKEGPRFYNPEQIDAGLGHVVGVDRYKRPYILSGTYFYSLGSASLKHVSTGPSGTWGCDSNNKVYKFVAGNWKVASGYTLQQVDAGGPGQVVGIQSTSNQTQCLSESRTLAFYGTGSLTWSYLSKVLMYVSCGPETCWGITNDYKVYVAKIRNTCSRATSWQYVSTGMKMIDVGTDGSVYALSTTGLVYQRTSISSSNYKGSRWTNIPMCMPIKHLTYDLKNLWVVTESRLLLVCTP
ncbi:fish-egg lectin-like [Solea solea]|uniref:fish-egg lectin-like n=1 Tax=Solea solea TaxID=90069 RepID=UPI00272B488F|nr:fish-egg lectin-like [Solea solea]